MAAIDLPSDPGPSDAKPFLQDFGGELVPFLGGPVQRINRIGTRFGIRCTMPPMRGTVSRQFQARLLRGKQERVVMEWPLLDFSPGSPGTPLVNTAASGGSAISVKGLTAGYTFQEGQFFSLIHGGYRYMYMSTGSATADGSGIAAVSIFPPLRSAISVNDVLEVTLPKIEGFVSPGDEFQWQLAVEHLMGFEFSVVEAR